MRSGHVFGKFEKFGKIYLNFWKIRKKGYTLMHFVHNIKNLA